MPEATEEKKARKSKTKTNLTKTTKAEEPVVQRSKSGQRMLKVPKAVWYKPFTWRYRQPVPQYKPLPKAPKLFWSVLQQLWTNKRLFGGIILVYGVLDIVFVRGLSSTSDIASLKSAVDHSFTGAGGGLATSAVTFSSLLSGSGSGNATQSGIYESILLITGSLALIWTLRQVPTGRMVRVRDSFYQGMYPLVPFFLVVALMGIQLLPLAIGSTLYDTVTSTGIAIHTWEKLSWLLLFIGLSLWSLRMITASLFALYIVTLPDMTPMRAYRSARKLVYGRRLLIWRKLIFLPVMLFILAAVISVPFILFITPLAVWVFFILTLAALPIVHGYLYSLYRSMI